MRTLGGRYRKIAVGWGVGCVAGVLAALPLALWTLTSSDALPGSRLAKSLEGVAVCQCGLGAVFGGGIGMALTHLLTSTPSGRRRIVWWGVGGTSVGAALGAALVAGIAATLPKPISTADLFFFAVIVGVFMLAGVLSGAVWGTDVAEQCERREKAGFGSALNAQRSGPQNATAERFGSPDEAGRAMIQGADRDRLTEARRKLDTASRPDDLD